MEVQLLSLISKTWIFILKWIEKIATLQKRDDQILEGWQNNPCNNLCGHGGMVDAIDLGSITERCGGSSPFARTILINEEKND